MPAHAKHEEIKMYGAKVTTFSMTNLYARNGCVLRDGDDFQDRLFHFPLNYSKALNASKFVEKNVMI